MNNQTTSSPDPEEKPYPGYAREKAALSEKKAASDRAHSEPFPGPLMDAFVNDPPGLHGFTLQPVTMSTIQILKRIHSPLLDVMRIMREELTRDDDADVSTPELAHAARAARMARANERLTNEIKPEEETMSGTIYCFIKPIGEVRALLKKGLETFEETALREIADRLPPMAVSDLQRAVSAHYSNSFSTIVNYVAPKGKDDGTVFTPPPAGQTTASAGGS